MKKMVSVFTPELLQQYTEHLRLEERSANTISKYRRDIRAFLAFLPEKTICKEGVLAYKQHLLNNGYRASSINSMLAAVNGFLGFIGRADCRVKQLRFQKRMFRESSKELSHAEYQQLVDTAEQTHQEMLQLLLQTLGGTGIRISELRFITVEAVNEGLIRISCKGKVREIALPRKLQRKLCGYCQKKRIASGCVFTLRSGKPIHRSTVWRKMKALCERASVASKKVFPHNFRHLFAYTFYQRYKNVVLLASLLGHSSVETTRIYTASTANEANQLIDGLGLI